MAPYERHDWEGKRRGHTPQETEGKKKEGEREAKDERAISERARASSGERASERRDS